MLALKRMQSSLNMPLLQKRRKEEKDIYLSSYTIKKVESNSLVYQTKTTAVAIVILLEMVVLFHKVKERPDSS
jgi:hypothetical protein